VRHGRGVIPNSVWESLNDSDSRSPVIGARSVVADDVPAYTVVAGNPARVIRRLDPEGRGVHDW
jgi:hypothetical protein